MPFILACPKCGSLLDCPIPDEYRCPRDQSSYLKKDGIWCFLPQERAPIYKAFIQDYEEIRRQEGRGSPDRAYYQALPFHDLTGRYQGDWRITGGGEWVLLTAWLGWHAIQIGEREKAEAALRWIEAQADSDGQLPEQVPLSLNDPAHYAPWRKRWGEIARPLLWSHAKYLILHRAFWP